ncbi:hypothetical protein WJX81_006329 [Elliptochloris bilobata]|uniref:RHOMBOID-like protein n=1 Tax=Elliptochloris bilobata TaxID=381761 RepID=A0AAW1RN23_9CHLO
MGTITLHCSADTAKLEYLVRSAFQLHRQGVNNVPESERQHYEQLLRHHLDSFLEALLLCTTPLDRQTEEEDTNMLPPPVMDAERVDLQSEVVAAAQRVAGLRASAPAQISSDLSRCLEARGPAMAALDAPVTVGDASTPADPPALSPAPAALQGRVVTAVAKMSTLRARLDEALERLQRVIEAVAGEVPKASAPPFPATEASDGAENTSPNRQPGGEHLLHPPHPLQEASSSEEADFRVAAVRPAVEEGDLSLYRDLLRKAHGDEELALRWLSDIGASAPKGILAERAPGKDLDQTAVEAGAPDVFFCPISLKLLRDPVLLPTGQTYERRYIQRWLAGGNSTCPASGQVLTLPATLTPNVALRKSIEAWAEKYALWLLDADGHVKPIPDDEDFAEAAAANSDADMALAIRLQEEEMSHISTPLPVPMPPSAPLLRRREARPSGGFARCSLLNAVLWALTAANVATFVLALSRNGWQIEVLGSNPLVGPSAAALRDTGAKDTAAMVGGGRELWRLASSLFLCSGMISLFVVVTNLWTFGKYLERVTVWPAASVLALYIICGLVGAGVSANLSVDAISAGAPAAVCGLLGAAWADQALNWRLYRNLPATVVVLLGVTGQFVLLGLLPLLDNFFVAPAFVAGLACGCVFMRRQRRRARGSCCWALWQVLCAVAAAGALAVGALPLSSGIVEWAIHLPGAYI